MNVAGSLYRAFFQLTNWQVIKIVDATTTSTFSVTELVKSH